MLFCNRDGDQVWNFRKVCYWTSVGAHYFTKVLDVTSVISLLRSYGYFWHLISLDWLQQAPKLTWRTTVWTGWIFSSGTVLHLSFLLLFSPPPWHSATPLRCASAFSPPLGAAGCCFLFLGHRTAGSFPATSPLCFILFGAIVISWGAKLETLYFLHSDVGFRSQLRMSSFIPLSSICHSLFLNLGLPVDSHWFVFAAMPFPASPCIKHDSCSQSLSSIPLMRERGRQSLETSVSWVLPAADAVGGRRGRFRLDQAASWRAGALELTFGSKGGEAQARRGTGWCWPRGLCTEITQRILLAQSVHQLISAMDVS